MKIVKWRNEPSVYDIMNSFFDNDLINTEKFNNYLPATNVVENENKFELELATPGLSKEDFKINLENNVLTISSEKEILNEQNDKNYSRKEFIISSFSRSFTLPKNVNVDRIKADYRDGILKIELPKLEEERNRIMKQIPIG